MSMMSNKVSRRQLLRTAGIAAAGLALAACAPVSTAKPATTKSEGEAQATTAAPAGQKKTVRVAHWWGDAFKPAMTKVQEIYTDIELKEEPSPWDGYHTKLLTEMAAGTGRDVYFADAYWFPKMFKSNVFAQLDDMFKGESGIDPKKWALDPKVGNGFKGNIYAVSQWFDTGNPWLWVNKSLTDKAGIKLPEYGTPEYDSWKWSDLLDACKAVTKRNDDGSFEQIGISHPGSSPWVHFVYVWQNGGEVFDPIEAIDETKCRLDEPPAIEAYQFIVDLWKKYKVALGPTEAQAMQAGTYLSGKVAFTYGWGIIGDMQKAKFDWTLIEVPWQKRRVAKYGGNSWAMNAKSEVKDAAWKVMAAFTTNKDVVPNFIKVGVIPSYDAPSYMNLFSDPGQVKMNNMLIEHATMNDAVRPWWWGSKNPDKFQKIVSDETDAMFLKDKPVEQALKDAAQAANDLFAKS